MPGRVENHAVFYPDYPGERGEAIDACFGDPWLESDAPKSASASLVRQPETDGVTIPSEISNEISGWMVGATGIEPVTPTMST